MNITDMRLAVMLGLDKTSALASPAFEDEEIDYWLNEAQLELVKRKAFGNNYRQEGIDDSVKRMDDLSPLVVTYTAEPTVINPSEYINARSVNMSSVTFASSSQYLGFIAADVRFSSPTNGVYPATLVKRNEIKNLVVTPTNIPYLRVPYVYISANKFNFIFDPYASISVAYITYLRSPKKMVAGTPGSYEVNACELPLTVHSEVVALAVTMMLENIESERLQTNQLMYNNKE